MENTKYNRDILQIVTLKQTRLSIATVIQTEVSTFSQL